MKPDHHTRRGFRNNHPHEHPTLGDYFRFLWGFRRRYEKPEFPRARNEPAALSANRTRPTLTWVGHSTFLIQMGGLNVLTDPHFTDRASPLRWAGPKRL